MAEEPVRAVTPPSVTTILPVMERAWSISAVTTRAPSPANDLALAAPIPEPQRDSCDFVFEFPHNFPLVGSNYASDLFDCSLTRTTKNDEAGHSMTFGA